MEPKVPTLDPHVRAFALPQDDYLRGGLLIYYFCYRTISVTVPLRMTFVKDFHSLNSVIPTERLKKATRNLEYVPRSQIEPEVPNADPHVIR